MTAPVTCRLVFVGCGIGCVPFRMDREMAWVYDDVKAQRAVDFFGQCLVHVKGALAGKPFALEPWQSQIVADLFGWVDDKSGLRRYRTAYVEIPRKNGKSTWAAGIALYLLLCDGEAGAEIYSAASTRDQASLVFSMAAQMCRHNPVLSGRLKINDSQKRIIYEKPASFYRAIPAEAASAHGFNAHGIIFDELHTQKSRELWDVLNTSTGARMQPLTVAITTAGHDRSSICWEQHEYARGVLDGTVDDDRFYAVIYGAAEDADWQDETVWAQANPCLDVSLSREYLRQECRRAKESPAYENTFRNLHLNQWTEQAVRWMPMEDWRACGGSLSEDDLIGRTCYAGLDVSSTRDLTSLVLVFPGDDGRFSILPYFWCPEDAITKRDRQDRMSYQGWVGTHIIKTQGNSIDQLAIRRKLWELSEVFDIQTLAFDPWNMEEFYQQLVREGWPEDGAVKFTQNHGSYNQPMKRLLELCRDRTLRHDGNPVLTWNMANVVAKTDHNGNIKPDKSKSQDKIDGCCALLMGLGCALLKLREVETVDDSPFRVI